MWKNKPFMSFIIIAVWTGLMNVGDAGATEAPLEFEGRLAFFKPLAVGMTAGTPDHPELVQIESIHFDKRYGNAWGVTARVGWLPVEDMTWRLSMELLDDQGNILHNSRDEPTVFTCKAGTSNKTDMRYAVLDLDAMQDQGRRHAARFRIHLEPSEAQDAGADSPQTLEIALVDQESKESIADAAVVVSGNSVRGPRRREKFLYCTDSQGHCRVKLAKNKFVTLRVEAQKKGYCAMQKSWSNFGSSALNGAPLVNLPDRHVMEMVRASALGGIVQDNEGKTIGGAEVHLDAHLEDPSGTININRSVRTDAKGCWRTEGLPGEADRVSLQIKHADYGGNNGRSRQLSGEALLNARAFKHVETLENGLTITGKVLNDQGKPITNATVMLAIRSYSPVYTLTDATGSFRLACSSDPSIYRQAPFLIVEAPGYAPVQQTINLPSKLEAMEFRLKRGRSIACRVVDTEGQPVAGVWTIVDPLPENRYYSVYLKDTNDRGESHISNVPQNDVNFHLLKQDYFSIRDHIVTVSENEVLFTMKRALRVHGTVTDVKTGKAIPHFEIADVYEIGGRTRTNRPVAYANGTYEASFDEARFEKRQLQVSAVGYEPATSDQIKMDEGEREINFMLTRSASFNEATAGRWREPVSPNGMRPIKGVVRDEQGKPVADAIVITCPMMGIETLTNAKGAFRLRSRGRMGTMPGEETTYLLVRQKERNLAVAMELNPSADTMDVTITPGVILSGKVVDVEGKRISSAKLSLTFWTSRMGYGIREDTKVNEAGHYEIKAVPPGHRYSVRANAEGYGERYVRVETADAVNNRMDVEPLVLSVANLSASGIVVDDLDQPVSGIRIYAYGNGQPSRETFTDTKGRFTIENVCPGRLSIQANSQGRAIRRFRGRAMAEGGATDIKIVVSEYDQSGRRVPTQPLSLVGKSLPVLGDFGIKFSPTDIEGKRILVCFWDMQQRPSRHCMNQLVKQATLLKQKDVIVIAVQASEIDEGTLKQWVKKYNVPFSVGMIQGDAKTIRFTWGAKSMPWLILTDTKHTVKACGFSVGELDEKFKAMD